LKLIRNFLAIALALLVAVQVVRNAAVRAWVDTSPAKAARIWAGHPQAELGLAMTGIGTAAREGQSVSDGIFNAANDAAAKAPLAAEPYLIRGVGAQVNGDAGLAQRAFEAARWRDPRSLPARYFLADQYLRTGNVRRGLLELAALARMTPQGIANASPYVAAYARDPRNWPKMKTLFVTDPDLAETTLEALSGDARNAPAILALADSAHRKASSPWLRTLVSALVADEEYAHALAIWRGVAGVRSQPGELLFDKRFNDPGPPPPFNWTLTSSTVGLSERQPGGRLHVIYYAQEEGALASQLLVLPAGRYVLSMRVSGGGEGINALSWTLTCPHAQTAFAAIPLTALAKGPVSFQVPRGCTAQTFELRGKSSDIPQQVDVTLEGLSLVRVQADG
jgi:uncharacterized protein YciI